MFATYTADTPTSNDSLLMRPEATVIGKGPIGDGGAD